jgi:hypothetical protein
VARGHNEIRSNLDVYLPERTTKVSIEPRFTSNSGQIVLFEPIVLHLDNIAIVELTPRESGCDLRFFPELCLMAGKPNQIQAKIEIVPVAAGQVYLLRVKTYASDGKIYASDGRVARKLDLVESADSFARRIGTRHTELTIWRESWIHSVSC